MSSAKPLPQDPKGAQREADVYDLLAWLEVNKKKVLTAAIVLVVLGFLIATVRYMREQKEAKASAQLLALKPTLNPSTNVVPPQASALLKVAEDFSGTAAAERARILAATTSFTDGKYADAEAEYSKFIKEHPESPWVANAAFGVAASQEAQNKPDAMASYQNVATAHANSAVADDAKFALARIHEQRKQSAEALRLYNELLAPRPGAQPGEGGNPAAFTKKEALLRAHPELNTNTPPALPAAFTTNQTILTSPPSLQISPAPTDK